MPKEIKVFGESRLHVFEDYRWERFELVHLVFFAIIVVTSVWMFFSAENTKGASILTFGSLIYFGYYFFKFLTQKITKIMIKRSARRAIEFLSIYNSPIYYVMKKHYAEGDCWEERLSKYCTKKPSIEGGIYKGTKNCRVSEVSCKWLTAKISNGILYDLTIEIG